MHSKSLEYLNLSSCGLRSKASGHVLDGLMKNRSIKYLCLNANSFASDDHLLAAKAGRMLQGHPRLLHVNLADCCLVREELIYLTMCIRDSKNIQGIHLTGNSYSHYDRLLMRALLPGKAKWPHPPASTRFRPGFAGDRERASWYSALLSPRRFRSGWRTIWPVPPCVPMGG